MIKIGVDPNTLGAAWIPVVMFIVGGVVPGVGVGGVEKGTGVVEFGIRPVIVRGAGGVCEGA